MLYMVLKESDYDKLTLIEKSLFTELPTNSLIKDFIFVNYNTSNHNECLELIIKNKIYSRFILPFISKRSFETIYKDFELTDSVYTQFEEYSFFEDLIAGYGKLFPVYGTEYILLPTLSTLSKEFVFNEIYTFNQKLFENKLLLSVNVVKPTLTELYLNAFDTVVEQEAKSDFINIHDIQYINAIYNELILSEFLIQASRHYTKKEIVSFIENKFIE